MTTERVLPGLALSPAGEVPFEEVTAALVFHLRDYDPVRDNYQLPQAADQVAGYRQVGQPMLSLCLKLIGSKRETSSALRVLDFTRALMQRNGFQPSKAYPPL